MGLLYRGTTERVNCGTALSVSTGAQTIGVWFYINTFGANPTKVMTRGTTGEREVTIRETGVMEIDTNGATPIGARTNEKVPRRRWTFSVWTISAGLVPTCYFGTLTAKAKAATYSSRQTGVALGSDAGLTTFIGNNNASDRPFNGIISSLFWIIGKELSLQEIREIQFDLNRVFIHTPFLDGFWKLGHPGIGTQPDLSGKGNHGTITGALMAPDPPLQKRWDYGRLSLVKYNLEQTHYRWRADDGALKIPA